MRQAGLDVSVACPQVRETARRDTAFVDRLKEAGVRVEIIPMRYGVHPRADARDYARLVRLMRHEKYDVVHAHSSKAGVLGRLSAWRCGVPAIVYTPNAFAFLGARTGLHRRLYLAIEQWLGRRVTGALICVSRSEWTLARQHGIAPDSRLVMIENAIHASYFSPRVDLPAAKSELGLDPKYPVIGYVGRLSRQKGIELLVQAGRHVVGRHHDVRFLVVGEGELEGEVRQMVSAHGLDGHVLMTGFRTDIPRVMEALDVFVLPSRYEGLPYTLMEAMAAGRAVVATDVGGNRDLIHHGKTGLLVPPSDADALADGLTGLLELPKDRERLGKAAWEVAHSRPTPEQMTHQVFVLYQKLLGRRRGE
jgi:glycosyltransferase involved in cell wall biosynthesis